MIAMIKLVIKPLMMPFYVYVIVKLLFGFLTYGFLQAVTAAWVGSFLVQ